MKQEKTESSSPHVGSTMALFQVGFDGSVREEKTTSFQPTDYYGLEKEEFNGSRKKRKQQVPMPHE